MKRSSICWFEQNRLATIDAPLWKREAPKRRVRDSAYYRARLRSKSCFIDEFETFLLYCTSMHCIIFVIPTACRSRPFIRLTAHLDVLTGGRTSLWSRFTPWLSLRSLGSSLLLDLFRRSVFRLTPASTPCPQESISLLVLPHPEVSSFSRTR